jgi:putative transposase
VRRILIRNYRPVPSGDGPSWLTVIGCAKDSLWSVAFFRCESILLKSYVFTRRLIGFGVAPADLDGPVICRMFNRVIAKQTPPQYLSSDNDPLFRFHRWRANLRLLEVDEIKTLPCTPLSHPFVERLIGTVRRDYLDRTLFWNRGDLERKLDAYQAYYNQHRCHTGLAGATPAERSGLPAPPLAKLESYSWRQHCNGLFQTPAPA